ncbi:MAG: NrfD/PsrC family molybdoenzyme membrane anchor subunit [Desulfurivibrio sp.]
MKKPFFLSTFLGVAESQTMDRPGFEFDTTTDGVTAAEVTAADTSPPNWFPIGMALGALMLGCLLFGLFQIFVVGHHTLGNTKEVPWNIFIVNYAFAISSIGLSYIASFGIVLGLKQFDAIARRALFLAILIIVAGASNVVLDARQPINAMFMMLTPHLTSPMGVVAVSINLYLVLIVTELYLLIKRGHHDPLVKVVAVAAFLTAVVVHSYHGAIFGLAYARDFWHGPYYPIYFLLSALFASSAIIILVSVLTYKATGQQIGEKLRATLEVVGKMLVYLLAIGLFFLYWKTKTGYYFGKPEASLLMYGQYALNFWMVEVLVGYVLPIIIIVRARFKDLNKMALAALLVLVGIYIGRYDFIIIGQLVPYLGVAPFDSDLGGSLATFATYVPTVAEIATTIGLLGVVWTGYILGMRYLPLKAEE